MGVGLWEALSVESQKWSFPTALNGTEWARSFPGNRMGALQTSCGRGAVLKRARALNSTAVGLDF